MKVRALKLFNDLQSKKLRRSGEMFEVSEKRASELITGPHGTLVEVIEEDDKQKGGEKIGSNRRGKGSTKN